MPLSDSNPGVRPVALSQSAARRDHRKPCPCNNGRVGTLLVLQLLTATSSPDVHHSVWVIERPGWQRQESALLEALRIYTSDLKAAITLKPDDARGNTLDAQLRAARDQCSSRVSMVVWFTGDGKNPVLQILHCATLSPDQLPCPRHLSVESLAQTLALKIRALLAQEPDLSLGDETSGTDGKAGDDLSTLEAALDAAVSTSGKPGDEVAEVQGSERVTTAVPSRPFGSSTDAPSVRFGIEIGLAYLVSSTADWAGVHQGGSVRVGVVLPRHHLAIELDGVLTTAVVSEATGFRTSLDEFPLGLALSRRWQRGKWVLSCGPRISVHFVHAQATSPDGRQGESWRTSVGLGAIELVRYDGWGPIGLFASLTNEIVLPRIKFTVAGQEMAGSGFFQGAILAGVVYRFF
jgi:hypothetical protein